ncbi:MAG: hypothetical protein H5T50_05305 [Nitrososphaeria archaeon]|nr:hypothetical protein [Nitrososphaeria archaeon]
MSKERITILVLFILSLTMVQIFSIMKRDSFQPSIGEYVAKLNISGGIAGMQIEVNYYGNGSVFYRNFRTNFEKSIQVPENVSKEFFERLKSLVEAYPKGFKLEPKPGSADFFTYKLTISLKDKEVSFEWTDTSEIMPELYAVTQIIYKINDMIVRPPKQEIILTVLIDKYEYKVGEKVVFKVVAKNVGSEDFRYSSPTPCHPDFKVTIYFPDGKEIEIYPKDVPMGRPCIQVVEERVLKGGEEKSSEYEYIFNIAGNYRVWVCFPYAQWAEERWEKEIEIVVH